MYPWHDCLEVIRSSISPCWTRWRVEAWLMNWHNYIMSKISNENPIDGTLKRVHTEVSDSTSCDEESMIKSLNVKKSKITSCKTWPRFLIIGSTNNRVNWWSSLAKTLCFRNWQMTTGIGWQSHFRKEIAKRNPISWICNWWPFSKSSWI